MNKVKDFVKAHIVSWIIEIVILSVIAFYTISETQKTAQQTRDIMTKYDAAISQYFSDKTKVIDNVAKEGYTATKDKLKNVDVEDVTNKAVEKIKNMKFLNSK